MKQEFEINDDLIVKYLCGEASPEEAIHVEQWRSHSKNNAAQFDQMQKSHQLVYSYKSPQPNKVEAWKNLQKAIPPQRNYRRIWMGLAAVFIAGALLVVTILTMSEDSNEIFADTEIKNERLRDNSEVTVMANSKITLAEGFGKTNRNLKLEGKADFVVEHEGAHPFTVEAGGVFIEDIGTAFTVENIPTSDTIFVVVKEGIVRLYDEDGNELIIKAGEKAWYIKSEKRIITDISTKVIKFDFKDTKLIDVVNLLRENYEIDIQLVPQKIGECTITTQFFDEEIATIITVISETMGFKYQYQNHLYKIEGKPCQ
jgi:transmembrane sensor